MLPRIGSHGGPAENRIDFWIISEGGGRGEDYVLLRGRDRQKANDRR